MDNISITIHHHPLRSDAATIRIKGFIYASTLSEIDKTLQSLFASQKNKILFDLSETNYVSSGGWGLFVSTAQKLRETGGDILLAAMKPEIFDAFELLDFHKLIQFFPTVESALEDGFGRAQSASSPFSAKARS